MGQPIEEARRQRAARASALEALEKGEVSIVEYLRSPPVALKKTDIWDLLLACPGIGPQIAKMVVLQANVWPHTHLGRLKPGPRKRIIENLPERCKHVSNNR